MNSQVNPYGPIMYSGLPIVITLLLVLVLGIITIVLLVRGKKDDTDRTGSPMLRQHWITESDKGRVRTLYLGKLSDLENRLRSGEIKFRPAYQELSVTIRDFVKDISGIDLTQSTLSELKLKNVPVVSSLIETYYEPEFAVETDDDVFKAINDARMVIGRWI